MTSVILTRLAVAGVTLASVAALTASPASANPAGDKHRNGVPVRLLTINDLHGNLEPPTGSSSRIPDPNGPLTDSDGSLTGIPGGRYSIAGGAAYLATHLKQLRNRNTLMVAAGDLIGATPLISAAYHDEPTISLLDRLGLATSSAGNHEFDEGIGELRRIMNGGCHPVDGCSPAGTWRGARFDYLAANVVKETGGYALPPFTIKKINGVKVGFIGLVTQTTPNIVTAAGIKGLRFTEEIAAANRVSRYLTRHGVKAQVVLVHEGDQITPNQDPSACSITPGAGSRIASGLDSQIDLVISGHSHQAYVCTTTDPAGKTRYYTQGSSFGRVITQIDFQIDRRTRDIIRSSVSAKNHVVTRTVTPDPDTAAFVQTWKDRVAAVANKPIGSITATIGRDPTGTTESPLGDLIADSQLAATRTGGNAEIALMNPGGVRADLTYPQNGSEGDGVVTYGEAFTVQPFNNLLQVVTLTGAQLDALLEQQWTDTYTRVLQPSASLTYTADLTKPIGSRVSDIKINGTPVTETQQIRVAANNFLVGGGDGFTVFTQGTDVWSGPLDIDALVAYFTEHSPIAPPVTNRITFVQ